VSSRRDQLFSYQFMVQRVISAFVYRDAELVQAPFRRAGGTLFIGAMVGVLALAAVGIYGVISPGGKQTWRNDQVLIMEKDTGARYVYLNGQLHPVVNYVSARLILKKQQLTTITVARASLRNAPRGTPLGIVGVPDSLPDKGRLVRDPWVLCSRPTTNETGQAVTNSVLFIGAQPTGGRKLSDQAILVKLPDGTIFLVWHDRRFLIRQPQIVLYAMAYSQAPVIPVAAAWLNAIPQGIDLGPIDIAKRGTASALRGVAVGQVLLAQSEGGEAQYHVALEDGIADITQVQANILLNDPATAAAYPGGTQPQAVKRTDLATAKRSTRKLLPAAEATAPPASIPKIADGVEQAGLCTSFADAGAAPSVTIAVTLPKPGAGVKTAGAGADEVVVTPGGGVLVQAAMSAEATDGTISVVTDLGTRYALTSPDVLGYLGYGARSTIRMPAQLVAMLPQGPALDPETAGTPAATG
jgi:type VII secretion protein EccB